MHVIELSHGLLKRLGILDSIKRGISPTVSNLFFIQLMQKTNNFGNTKWFGQPIWQNTLDLWTIQETIAEIKPALLIETGTNQGGSALFYANLFDLMNHGRVITVDIETMHDVKHPRIEFLLGSSTADSVVERMSQAVAATDGPVMVILDSDHSREHVAREIEIYSPMVTPGSYILVQDGIMDALPVLRRYSTPGPLPAIEDFINHHPEFEIDEERCNRFIITQHPKGWLKRRALEPH